MACVIAIIYGARSGCMQRCCTVRMRQTRPTQLARAPSASPTLPAPPPRPLAPSLPLCTGITFLGQGSVEGSAEHPADLGDVQNVMGLLFSTAIFVGALPAAAVVLVLCSRCARAVLGCPCSRLAVHRPLACPLLANNSPTPVSLTPLGRHVQRDDRHAPGGRRARRLLPRWARARSLLPVLAAALSLPCALGPDAPACVGALIRLLRSLCAHLPAPPPSPSPLSRRARRLHVRPRPLLAGAGPGGDPLAVRAVAGHGEHHVLVRL